MSASASPTVCVIIAAKDAAATVGRAVRSALAQPEVAQVILVDDGSADDTCGAATAAGDGRLQTIRLERNLGPSGARNRALEAARADLVAILDADDFMLPGRIGKMLARSAACDILADDLLYSDDDGATVKPRGLLELAEDDEDFLTFERFVLGNISRPGRPRGELGFLKPLMRRDFLTTHGLVYDPSLRLGEDFALYARALAAGARFKVVPPCGYVSVVRPDSLSGRHSAEDLAALCAFDAGLAQTACLAPSELRALRRHEQSLRVKVAHRQVLQAKAERDYGRVARMLLDVRSGPGVAAAIARDKLRR
ncbi:MAG: glycosyltransferase family 2 protein [Phenylobacterium sp.]|jgi:succinoglycan biosynthesis protein ExoU|uniref:glycosyltransferase family 2 protein n=1 Tax=Phenylobacterium sp. TaxID=1871053 RepID=UPI00391918D5